MLIKEEMIKVIDKMTLKTEQDYAKEELDRILQPVEDEEVAKEISDYRQNDDESDEVEENANTKEEK